MFDTKQQMIADPSRTQINHPPHRLYIQAAARGGNCLGTRGSGREAARADSRGRWRRPSHGGHGCLGRPRRTEREKPPGGAARCPGAQTRSSGTAFGLPPQTDTPLAPPPLA